MQIEKGQQALDAAEEIAFEAYSSHNREIARELFDEEDLPKLRYLDSFLLVTIHSSRIVEHISEPDEYWIIEVTVDIGIVPPPEEYIVYQGPGGDWVVEQKVW